MKNVVLTGAAGFLGRNTVPLLLASGMRVTAVTSKQRDGFIPLVKIASGDASRIATVSSWDSESVERALSCADLLINCAFPRSGDGYGMAEGLNYINHLFLAAGRQGVGAIINISSQSVYSQKRDDAATEDDALCLESPYAVAKYATEVMLLDTCGEIPHTNIRLASLIGSGFNQRSINKMIKRAFRGLPITIGDLTGRYGYLDVRDAAQGIAVLAKSNPMTWQEVYNLGPSVSYTIEDMALEVSKEFKRRGNRVEVIYDAQCNTDTNTNLSSERFAQQFGWYPEYTLSDTVKEIMKDLRI